MKVDEIYHPTNLRDEISVVTNKNINDCESKLYKSMDELTKEIEQKRMCTADRYSELMQYIFYTKDYILLETYISGTFFG